VGEYAFLGNKFLPRLSHSVNYPRFHIITWYVTVSRWTNTLNERCPGVDAFIHRVIILFITPKAISRSDNEIAIGYLSWLLMVSVGYPTTRFLAKSNITYIRLKIMWKSTCFRKNGYNKVTTKIYCSISSSFFSTNIFVWNTVKMCWKYLGKANARDAVENKVSSFIFVAVCSATDSVSR